MPYRVRLAKAARRRLRRVPGYVVDKLEAWIEMVEADGLREAQRIPGYHDEPLKGARTGQRSIRLSRQWRAMYEVKSDGEIDVVLVQEVTPHDY